jgi:hypothetical protein
VSAVFAGWTVAVWLVIELFGSHSLRFVPMIGSDGRASSPLSQRSLWHLEKIGGWRSRGD